MKKVVFISVLISINLLLEQKAFSQSSVELIPYRNKQMKWGYCDKNKKIIIPCEYDEVQLFRENIAFVRKGKKWGTIDTKGKVIINFQYSEVRYPFNNGVAVVIKNNQLSYIDTNGKETNKPSKYLSSNSNIENEFDKYCYNPENLIFNTNLAKVQKDELWALKDEKGKLVTPFKYYCIEDFKEGMAKVASKIEYISIVSNQGTETIKSCALYGFVDANGKEIIPCKYAYATDFKFGFTAVLTYPDTVNVDANTNYIDNAKKKTLIFDKKGNQLAEIDENSASFISNDSLLVLVKPGYRILAIYKLNGKALIPSNKYDLIEFLLFRMYDTEQLIIFPYNLACVVKNGKKGVISKNAQEVLPCEYDEIFTSKDFIFAKKEKKWGIFSNKGEAIIPCKYDDIGLIENNRLDKFLNSLRKNFTGNFVSSRGEVFLHLIYSKDLFLVVENGILGYIDTKGNKYWD